MNATGHYLNTMDDNKFNASEYHRYYADLPWYKKIFFPWALRSALMNFVALQNQDTLKAMNLAYEQVQQSPFYFFYQWFFPEFKYQHIHIMVLAHTQLKKWDLDREKIKFINELLSRGFFDGHPSEQIALFFETLQTIKNMEALKCPEFYCTYPDLFLGKYSKPWARSLGAADALLHQPSKTFCFQKIHETFQELSTQADSPLQTIESFLATDDTVGRIIAKCCRFYSTHDKIDDLRATYQCLAMLQQSQLLSKDSLNQLLTSDNFSSACCVLNRQKKHLTPHNINELIAQLAKFKGLSTFLAWDNYNHSQNPSNLLAIKDQYLLNLSDDHINQLCCAYVNFYQKYQENYNKHYLHFDISTTVYQAFIERSVRGISISTEILDLMISNVEWAPWIPRLWRSAIQKCQGVIPLLQQLNQFRQSLKEALPLHLQLIQLWLIKNQEVPGDECFHNDIFFCLIKNNSAHVHSTLQKMNREWLKHNSEFLVILSIQFKNHMALSQILNLLAGQMERINFHCVWHKFSGDYCSWDQLKLAKGWKTDYRNDGVERFPEQSASFLEKHLINDEPPIGLTFYNYNISSNTLNNINQLCKRPLIKLRILICNILRQKNNNGIAGLDQSMLMNILTYLLPTDLYPKGFKKNHWYSEVTFFKKANQIIEAFHKAPLKTQSMTSWLKLT